MSLAYTVALIWQGTHFWKDVVAYDLIGKSVSNENIFHFISAPL